MVFGVAQLIGHEFFGKIGEPSDFLYSSNGTIVGIVYTTTPLTQFNYEVGGSVMAVGLVFIAITTRIFLIRKKKAQ